MTDSTPLQTLDDAVNTFIRTLDPEATPNGWVISYQTSYLQAEDANLEPISYDASYAVSSGLSPFAAIGLAHHAGDTISSVYRTIHEQDDDE